MIMPELPIISVKGTPFECGQQYGTAAGKLIHQNVDRYLQRWQRMSGTGRSEILKIGKEFVTAIGEYDSDILHEINGIAKGAELSLEEVVTLNARYEISSHAIIAELSEGGCTSAAAQPEVTKEGHTIIGQNWDLWPGVQGLSVILEVVQGNKPPLVTITEAGVVAHGRRKFRILCYGDGHNGTIWDPRGVCDLERFGMGHDPAATKELEEGRRKR